MFEVVRLQPQQALQISCRKPSAARNHCIVLLTLIVAGFLVCSSCGSAQAAGNNAMQDDLRVAGTFMAGEVGQSYNAVLSVSGGNSPYQFALKSGTLPPGVVLNPTTGSVSGKPTSSGSYSFEIIATDSPLHDQGTQAFAISVSEDKNGGYGGNKGGGGGGSISVTVSPASASLVSGQTQQFTASVSGTSDTAVTWTATSGSVNASGLFTSPTVSKQSSVTVTATTVATPTVSASASLTVNPQTALQITTGNLPQAQQGSPYSENFTATGGTSPYSWSISAGNPPAGTSMPQSGDFGGVPTSTGNFSFTALVTDATGKTASGNFSLTVAVGSGYDGPAQLPIATVAYTMADTPAPGPVVNVSANSNLQSALNSAQCGNTIQLQAGATFSGTFILPNKNCDDQHWIIIRTSAPDSSLPAEGTRLTPCYAGVASLQGRPQYSCNNPQNVLAKLVVTAVGDGPIQFAFGASYYRLLGLEITRATGVSGAPALISPKTGGTGSFIVVDRSWIHGTTQDDTRSGIELPGTNSVAVVNSYFSDFHCTADVGACTDAHAVFGGTGDHQDGPYVIAGNFLEASGEAILFGGGPATVTPTDITITDNHMWKPWQWMPGNNPFVGGAGGHPFVVKNHLELKNAVRVLAEANLMENTWGGFSQFGFGILVTPKNQHTLSGQNVCSACQVTDVTIRYDHVSYGAGGLELATAISGNGADGAPALAGTRWSIHDIVIDNISGQYTGPGTAIQMGNNWPKNPLNTVTVNHITAFPDPNAHMMVIGDLYPKAPMYAFVFTNNLIVTGRYPVWNSGGGQQDCAYDDIPLTTVNNCFSSYTFGTNGLIAAPEQFPPDRWPTGNFFPPTISYVQFIDYDAQNYELALTSPYKNAGTDGKDLGADIVGLNQALQNVE
jgi:hypothetical protein